MHRFVGMLLVCAALLACLCYWHTVRTQYVTTFFSAMLEKVQAQEEVELGGKVYLVVKNNIQSLSGKEVKESLRLPILELAYAKTLARRNPLMALPGVTTSQTRDIITNLEILQQELAAIQSAPVEKTLVTQALYPIHFLRAMTDVEDARREFLHSGNRATLYAYEKKQDIALVAFKRDLERYRAAFIELVPDTSQQFELGDMYVSYDSVLQTLEALKKANGHIRTLYEHRISCLRGFIRTCPSLELPALSPVLKEDISESELALADDIVYLFKQVATTSPVSRESPNIPIIALSQSHCTDGSGPPLFSIIPVVSTVGLVSFAKVNFVGDIRFIDSHSLDEVPFFRFFATRNVTYIPTSPLLHYGCPTFALDAAAVNSVYAVSRFAVQTPLSAYAEDEKRQQLRELETLLTTSTERPLYESDARNYLIAAAELIRTGALPIPVRDAAIAIILEMHVGSSGFNELLLGMIDIDTTNARIWKKGIPVDLAASYIFFFRSPFLFLFMSHNPSVAGIPPLTQAAPAVNRKTPYVFYSHLPHTEAFVETILEDMRVYREVHVGPAETPLEGFFMQ